MNESSIKFFLSTWTRSSSKALQSKFLQYMELYKYRIYISNVQQLNGNSIKFFLLTWTRSSSKTLQSKFLYTQNKRQLSSRVSSTQQLHYNQVLFQLWSMSWLDKIAKLLFIFLFFSFSFLFLFGLTTQEKSVRKCHRIMSYSQSHISRYHRVTSHDRVI